MTNGLWQLCSWAKRVLPKWLRTRRWSYPILTVPPTSWVKARSNNTIEGYFGHCGKSQDLRSWRLLLKTSGKWNLKHLGTSEKQSNAIRNAGAQADSATSYPSACNPKQVKTTNSAKLNNKSNSELRCDSRHLRSRNRKTSQRQTRN